MLQAQTRRPKVGVAVKASTAFRCVRAQLPPGWRCVRLTHQRAAVGVDAVVLDDFFREPVPGVPTVLLVSSSSGAAPSTESEVLRFPGADEARLVPTLVRLIVDTWERQYEREVRERSAVLGIAGGFLRLLVASTRMDEACEALLVPHSPWRVDAYAVRLGCSERHMQESCRRAGFRPSRAIALVRALRLIGCTLEGLSLASAGRRVGFSSAASASRFVRSMCGHSYRSVPADVSLELVERLRRSSLPGPALFQKSS